MRIERLIAERYGKFEDFSLSLPAPAAGVPDLHLVLGVNEAGKSTLRRGILELFYGFPAQKHAMSYRHAGETEFAADLSEDGAPSLWRRTRAKKNSLVDAGGTPIPAATQGWLLGAMSKEEFEAMYCLDHESLREGGESILKGQSDLGRMLFEAATGLRTLGAVQQQIDEAWSSLIAEHGRSNSVFKGLVAQAKEADAAKTAAEMLEPEFRRRVEARDRAREALRDARQALLSAQTEHANLERFATLLPLLTIHKDHAAKLDQVPAGPDLPANAATLLDKYEADRAERGSLLMDAQQELAAREQDLADCPARDDVLDLATEIGAIAGGSDQPRKDLSARRGEHKALVFEASGLATGLGFSAMPLAQLRKAVPSFATRTALQQTLNALNNSRSHEVTLKKQYEDAEAAVAEAKKALDESPPATVSQALGPVLDAANTIPGVGDIETAERQAQGNLQAALIELAPWRGEVDQLRALVPPTAEALADWAQREAQLTRQLNEQAANQRTAVSRRKDADNQLRLLPDVAETGSHEVMRGERSARDDAWSQIKTGAVTPTDGAPKLEQHTATADREADALIGHAQDAARREAAQRQMEAADRDIEEAIAAKARLDDEMAVLKAEVSAACAQLGISDQARTALQGWLVRRAAALQKADEARNQASALKTRKGEVEAGRTAVTAALAAEGQDPQRLAEMPLPALTRLGKELLDAQRAKQNAHNSATQSVIVAQASVDKLRPQYNTAKQAASDAQQVWDKALRAAALPAQVTAATFISMLPQINKLESKLGEIQGIDVRVHDMETFLKEKEEQWRALAAKARMPVDDQTAEQLEISLRDLLVQAQVVEQRRREATTARDNARNIHSKAVAGAKGVEDGIKGLLTQAGTEDIAEAKTLAAHSDTRRELRGKLESSSNSLLVAGGGRTLEQIAAELAGHAPDTVDAEKRRLAEELPGLNMLRDNAQTEAETAEREVAAVTGGGGAAAAAGQRLQVHARMAEVVRQYQRLKAASIVIKRALQIYREEKQGPVLQLAGRYFSELTNGAFERLAIDEERSDSSFAGIRAGAPAESRKVSIEGLSDGTRDQLYLALRLAGVELQIRENQRRVPVVCDDLFVHFDDDRAGSALKALSVLGASTQVIYFTHHPHLVQVALLANSNWQVHRLQPE
jgi:uncharacterized protein YhaN